MRILYSCLFYLLIPFILLRLLWRSIKAPAYRDRWNERFAFYKNNGPSRIDAWFHAVSVGEAEAVFPLIRKIRQHHPDAELLVTTTTPTGSARVKSVLKDSVRHVYLPYDIPSAVARFIRHFRPAIAVVVETEIWPNLFACCGKNGIPLYIVNARMSEKSARGYRKIPTLVGSALAPVSLIGAQTDEDAGRFIAVGARPESVATLGNIKFDVEIPPSTIDAGRRLKADLFAGRFVWLAASTHKGEEAVFLQIYPAIKENIPELLLVIVPRHPERFSAVKKLCAQHRRRAVTRSSGVPVTPETDVYLADTMGELKMLYASSDAAFVGGSLVPTGGHNVLEASAAGIPVMFGPYMGNFKEIASGILKQNAAIQCQNQQAVADALLTLYRQPDYRQELIANGRLFIGQNQGALAHLYDVIEQAMSKMT